MKKYFLLYIGLTLISACGKKDRFQRFDDYQRPSPVSFQYAVKSTEKTNSQVDILWVIDNSGSMRDIQNNVIQNTRAFIEEFDKKGGIDWKMALISTDEDEKNYLGMDSVDGFNYKSPNRVFTFTNAVSRLGLNGSTTEKSFSPIQIHLSRSYYFTRQGALLVIINLTDAEEQSRKTSSSDFINFLESYKGIKSKVKYYGVYSAADFGCTSGEGRWNYADSKYKEVIDYFGGVTFPACAPDFGYRLTDLAKEIISYLQSRKITLEKRPRPETIKVYYKGEQLAGGAKEDGALWYYDFNDNAIVFYSLDFAPGNIEYVKVDFEEDDGY